MNVGVGDVVSFVSQDDVLHSSLTVNETLSYSSKFAHDHKHSKQIDDEIFRVLSSLSLHDHGDQMIGHTLSSSSSSASSSSISLSSLSSSMVASLSKLVRCVMRMKKKKMSVNGGRLSGGEQKRVSIGTLILLSIAYFC
jgi:ABC-type multidrug transport system ATPase subunit